MTKFGNKGFMMAEVVVVSVIVAVTLVTLYTGINRVTSAFNLRNRYYDLDCLNLSVAVNDTLIRNGEINTIINCTDSDIIDGYYPGIDELLNLYSNYTDVRVYFIKCNVDTNDNKTISIDRIGNVKNSTNDYFNYLANNLDDNNYYIVSEICKKGADDCYYYGLGVK